jgi:probable RNA-binding protein EIF1AD
MFVSALSPRPPIFNSTPNEASEAGTQAQTAQIDEEPDSDEDDDLPPLEANTNRNRPYELYSDSDSGSDA